MLYSVHAVYSQLPSRVWLFVATWTVARQAPLSTGFSRQGYWTGLSFPTPGDLPDPGIEPTSLTSPAKDCHFLLQEIFPTQGLNPHLLCLLHCWQILYHCTTWVQALLLYVLQSSSELAYFPWFQVFLSLRAWENHPCTGSAQQQPPWAPGCSKCPLHTSVLQNQMSLWQAVQ